MDAGRRLVGPGRRLTPEEDAIGDDEGGDDIDDTLPADLWFRLPRRIPRFGRRGGPYTSALDDSATRG